MATLKVSCHCRRVDLSLELPEGSIPLKSALCHCNSCRHVTGQLFATYMVIPLPSPPEELLQEGLLAKYESSEMITRYFCTTCGATIMNVEPGEFEFATGTGTIDEFSTEGKGDELLDGKLNRAMLWVSDTKDGGAAIWINGGKADGWKRWMEGRNTSAEVTDEMLEEMVAREIRESETMQCYCHCGDVKFSVLRPDGGRDQRYPACLCACWSCMKTSGFEITAWAKVPKSNIKMEDGGKLDLNFSGFGHYESSKNVVRYFCKRCGAKVFYTTKDGDVVDISVGVVDSSLGARAESWLRWNADGEDVAFPEDAIDREFVKGLTEGIRTKT